jgi:hypothetical protein
MLPESELIASAAEQLKRTTKVLDHEAAALTHYDGDTSIRDLFLLLAEIDVMNARLYKQLVAWHTQFPERPSLEQSDIFWRDLKKLREAKLQMDTALQLIREQEKRMNTLTTQLVSSQQSVGELEHFFDAYLDRVHKN